MKKCYCEDCGKLLGKDAYYFGHKRCKKCAKLGSHNSFYGKKHTNKTKEKIRKSKLGKPTPWMIGNKNPMKNKNIVRKMSETIKQDFKTWRKPFFKNKKLSKKYRNKISKATKKAMKCIKHHIDLNKDNNRKSNIIYLSGSKHSTLHLKAYEYLVKINKIKDYIKWFNKIYKLERQKPKNEYK
jgi:hypothetical protein